MRPHTVTIVEDNATLSANLAEIFEMEGYITDIVSNGAIGYNRIAETRPDLVILDLHLPNVSGLEILDQIRADPELSSIKVIVVTGDVEHSLVAEGKADIVFKKPYSMSQLVERVNHLINSAL